MLFGRIETRSRRADKRAGHILRLITLLSSCDDLADMLECKTFCHICTGFVPGSHHIWRLHLF